MEAVEELESADQKMNIRGWSRLSGLIPQQQQAVVAAQPQVVTPPPPHGVAPTGAQDTTAQGRVTVELQLQEGRRPHGAEESPATMDVIV